MRTARSVVPLALLGAARIVAVKSTDYQEHVSEYGVHWNFFFTLFVVTFAVALLAPSTVVVAIGVGVAVLCGTCVV